MSDIKIESVKSAPPLIVTASSSVGDVTLNQYVAIATLAYIALQAAWLIWKWYRAARTKGWAPKDEA
jgi:hypothetical protein